MSFAAVYHSLQVHAESKTEWLPLLSPINRNICTFVHKFLDAVTTDMDVCQVVDAEDEMK